MTNHPDNPDFDETEIDAEQLARLRDSVRALPRAIEPQRDAWSTIRARIAEQQVTSIAPDERPAKARPRREWPIWLAAAVLLIAISSTITTRVMREKALETAVLMPRATDPARQGTGAAATQVSSESMQSVYARYDAAANDLADALAARRARLDPATLAVVDSCLRRIDAAIAEARAALGDDPGNRVITDLLTVTYQQKLDLLKRATDLPLRQL